MDFHEQILDVIHLGTSLAWLIGLVWLVWLIGLIGLVAAGLLLGLGLVLAGHAHVEGGDHLGPGGGARGAEEGDLAGLQVEAGEVSQLLQHLSRLGLATTWLVRLGGLVATSTIATTATTATTATSTIATVATRLVRLVRLKMKN